MVDFYKVGQKIANYRKEKQLTQDELAEELFVTRQALSKWENGTGVPSIDTILSLCKIFGVSFEELLCLNDEPEKINPDNIFAGHDRKYIISKLLNNELDVNISDIFYQLSVEERFIILRAIKDGKIKIDMQELYVKLTISEQRFLGGVKNGNF